MKKIVYLIVVCVVLFSACKKMALVETTKYETITPGDPKYSYVKILNLSPGSPVLTFNVDGAKFSAALSSAGSVNAGYTYNGLFPDLGYAVATPGTRIVSGNVIPSATADANLEVFNASVNLAAGKYYSIIPYGIYNTTTKKIPSSYIIEDIRPATDTTKIFVRMANFYNNGPSLDLLKDSATGTKLISNSAFGTVSDWVSIPNPGNTSTPSNKFYLNVAGTSTTLISAGATLSLSKGRAYTIYLRGTLGSTAFPATMSTYTTFY
ncbi:hypothetical protein ACJVDH_20950 [Pedobacter sp. AW1-32]|uniref:hypothetical protein n=1 Tax=Pedobacter sp. AW1-32 TaxID=3383026 RepID=UPI003FF08831